MGTAEELCEPSMVSGLQGCHTSEEPPGSHNSHSSSMEGPTLVLCSTGDAIRLPSTAIPLTESIPAGVRHYYFIIIIINGSKKDSVLYNHTIK